MAGEWRREPGFWRGRSVFLTGHTGFVGGWLALLLVRMGARVTGYSLRPPTEPCFFDCVLLNTSVSDTECDVRDRPRLEAAVAAAKPQVLLHLAAQPIVGTAFRDPYTTFSTNVLGTLNVLEAVRAAHSIEAAIIFTTDKVYLEESGLHRFEEGDPLGGREPYALSKASAEFVVEAYRHSEFMTGRHNLGLATVRAGNIIGGGDWAPDRLVPDAIRAFRAEQPLMLRKPQAVRPWQFILDALDGLLLLAEATCRDPRTFSGPWNFGPPRGATATVARVADELVRHWGSGATWRAADEGIPETLHLEIDSTKAAVQLGWKPKWPLKTALGHTVAWYRSFYARENMLEVTSRQLDEHCS